jgi:hypothetical protein
MTETFSMIVVHFPPVQREMNHDHDGAVTQAKHGSWLSRGLG